MYAGSNGSKLGDAAENSKIENGVMQMARTRAAAIMSQCAKMAMTGPWTQGAAERFLAKDELQQILDTNQGRFVIIIRRG